MGTSSSKDELFANDATETVTSSTSDYKTIMEESSTRDRLSEFLEKKNLHISYNSQYTHGDMFKLSLKFVILGASCVGKTCFMRSLDGQPWENGGLSTIGACFQRKPGKYKNVDVVFEMWDTAGNERFRAIIQSCLKGAYAAIICYDITSEYTFVVIENYWLSVVEQMEIPCVFLIGTKLDLEEKREVSKEKAEVLAKKHGWLFAEVSSKQNVNVDTVLPRLATTVLETVADAFTKFRPRTSTSITTVDHMLNSTVKEAIKEKDLSFPIMLRTKKNRKSIHAVISLFQNAKRCIRIKTTRGWFSSSKVTELSMEKVYVSRANRLFFVLNRDKIDCVFRSMDKNPYSDEIIVRVLMALEVKIVNSIEYENLVEDLIDSCNRFTKNQFNQNKIVLRFKELNRSSSLSLDNLNFPVPRQVISSCQWTHLITNLDLSGNHLGDSFVVSIVQLICSCSSIKQLNLDRNKLTSNHIHRFTALTECISARLEKLSIAHNQIGDGGTITLLEVFRQLSEKNNVKPSLILSDNNITTITVDSICKVISKFSLIDVSDNPAIENKDDVIKSLSGLDRKLLSRIKLYRTPLFDSEAVRKIYSDNLIDKAIERIDELNQYKHWIIEESELNQQEFVRIGEGSQGAVFKASWRGTPVAVKEVYVQDDMKKKDFLIEEIAILFNVMHPNCLSFLALSTTESKIYIVTELMDRPLQSVLMESVVLSAKKKLHIAIQIARALSYLHQTKPIILHRDINPSNIFVDETLNIVKVGDFGLSKTTERTVTDDSLLGTRDYWDPNLFSEPSYSWKCDVYSFSIVLWQIWYHIAIPYPMEYISNGPLYLLKQVSEGLRPKTDIQPDETMKPIQEPMSELINDCWAMTNRPNFSEIVERLELMNQKLD